MARSDAKTQELMQFLLSRPLLTPRDKRGVLGLLAKTANIGSAARPGNNQAKAGKRLASVSGVRIFRQLPEAPERVYKVSGIGELPVKSEVAFELVCNPELIPEWDMLFKGVNVLGFAADDGVEVAYLRIVYGLPGFSRLVSDRDFLVRAVRVFFPNGVRVLYCRSIREGEVVAGDPGQLPRTIRGCMGDSGFVVMPTRKGCIMNLTLQVDPKGWIPTSVVNFSLEAIPLNIHRIGAALQRLPHTVLANLAQRNQDSYQRSCTITAVALMQARLQQRAQQGAHLHQPAGDSMLVVGGGGAADDDDEAVGGGYVGQQPEVVLAGSTLSLDSLTRASLKRARSSAQLFQPLYEDHYVY